MLPISVYDVNSQNIGHIDATGSVYDSKNRKVGSINMLSPIVKTKSDLL